MLKGDSCQARIISEITASVPVFFFFSFECHFYKISTSLGVHLFPSGFVHQVSIFNGELACEVDAVCYIGIRRQHKYQLSVYEKHKNICICTNTNRTIWVKVKCACHVHAIISYVAIAKPKLATRVRKRTKAVIPVHFLYSMRKSNEYMCI